LDSTLDSLTVHILLVLTSYLMHIDLIYASTKVPRPLLHDAQVKDITLCWGIWVKWSWWSGYWCSLPCLCLMLCKLSRFLVLFELCSFFLNLFFTSTSEFQMDFKFSFAKIYSRSSRPGRVPYLSLNLQSSMGPGPVLLMHHLRLMSPLGCEAIAMSREEYTTQHGGIGCMDTQDNIEEGRVQEHSCAQVAAARGRGCGCGCGRGQGTSTSSRLTNREQVKGFLVLPGAVDVDNWMCNSFSVSNFAPESKGSC
jgi:hypothetical protein